MNRFLQGSIYVLCTNVQIAVERHLSSSLASELASAFSSKPRVQVFEALSLVLSHWQSRYLQWVHALDALLLVHNLLDSDEDSSTLLLRCEARTFTVLSLVSPSVCCVEYFSSLFVHVSHL